MRITANGTVSPHFFHVIRLQESQELLLALQPSPPGLDHGTRPGIPAAAELARGPGPEDVEHEGERGRGGHSNGPDLAMPWMPTWFIMRNQPGIDKISPTLRPANSWSLGVTLAAALLRQRRLLFLPYHGCLSAKGDLLSIVPQELLLDLGPLTSWP